MLVKNALKHFYESSDIYHGGAPGLASATPQGIRGVKRNMKYEI